MNESKFWKIVYLYVTKYNYDVIYYRPEKKDIWLINSHNELLRFVYSPEMKVTEVDASVYNIIKNEKILKKVFKLSSLKVKVLYISEVIDENIPEYKKYKISDKLLIERIILSSKNRDKFVKKEDDKFVDLSVDNDRYKNRVVESYKNKDKANYLINFYFNLIGIVFVLLFSLNFLILYYTNSKTNIYGYIDYNYQKIISGDFYRLFSDLLVFDSINHLLVVAIFIFLCSILLGEDIKLLSSVAILSVVALVSNLFIIFGYVDNINIASISFFGLLGAVFILELNRRNNNLKFMYALAMPVLYLLISTLFFQLNLPMYMFAFILGVFVQIAFLQKINVKITYAFIGIILLSGLMINVLNVDLRGNINNYKLKNVEARLKNVDLNTNTDRLEREITTKNKSILTYYELGSTKIVTASVADAKKIFLEGVDFDNSFAPIYYKLAIIEYSEFNKEKSLEYINKALELDLNNTNYKKFRDELVKK